MLDELRELAPKQLAARVGDANDNLSYEMQDACDGDITSMLLRGKRNKMRSTMIEFRHDDDATTATTTTISLSSSVLDDIQSLEHSVQSKLQNTHTSYRGSYMRTLNTTPQPAHVDYDYPTLAEHGKRLFLAFFPLTEEGAYLQLWHDPALHCVSDDDDELDHEDGDDDEKADYNSMGRIVEGTIVYIPYGKMLIVPSDTIHGGGFKRGVSGNLRFHLYIALGDDIDTEDDDCNSKNNINRGEEKRIELLQHPMNKYTERYDRTRELCERFVDSNGLNRLLRSRFFDD